MNFSTKFFLGILFAVIVFIFIDVLTGHSETQTEKEQCKSACKVFGRDIESFKENKCFCSIKKDSCNKSPNSAICFVEMK